MILANLVRAALACSRNEIAEAGTGATAPAKPKFVGVTDVDRDMLFSLERAGALTIQEAKGDNCETGARILISGDF
jgi:hypothetical protein